MSPLTAMIHSVQAGKGVYVPLIGSGVSRAAAIPTGHEVMLDLIRRIALVEAGGEIPPDLVVWFRERHGKAPTYSTVLESLGRTAAERTNIIRRYFEPDEDERTRGLKLPTRGHQALARLAASGHFRLFLTTNFDHLLEQALRDQHLDPLVVYNADQIRGLPPVAHLPLCVVKLHGDYADLRTMNTSDELSTYDEATNAFLDRVLDEYGLIVCGWSGEYDVALRAVFERCRSRRYTTFWCCRHELGESARALVALRDAVTVPIREADELFHELAEGVEALGSIDREAALSKEIAVARLKRYLQDSNRYIDLQELAARTAQDATDRTRGRGFDLFEPPFTSAAVAERVGRYEQAVEILMHLLFAGGCWGNASHSDLWIDAIQRVLGPDEPRAGNEGWIDLADYPALTGFYACGLGAVAGRKPDTVVRVLRGGRVRYANQEGPFLLRLHQWFLRDAKWLYGVPGLDRKKVPVSERLFELMKMPARDALVEASRYEEVFDEWELLLSLAISDERDRRFGDPRTPVGRFCYRHHDLGAQSILVRARRSLESEGDGWSYVRAGLFGGSAARGLQLLDVLERQQEMSEFYR
jgi:hypothetical protein